MKMHATCSLVAAIALLFAGLSAVPNLVGATSLRGDGTAPGSGTGAPLKAAIATKDEIVAKYVDGCQAKAARDGTCDKLQKDAVEILKEDLRTLGSSANRTYMPVCLKMFKSDEPELRIASADAIGMIGVQDQDIDVLTPLVNDPIPDVRRAALQAIGRGKGPALTLLGQRALEMHTGLKPDTIPDPGKSQIPVAPESTYLFFASDPASGRLSYLAKGMNEATAFFKGKAKHGPFKLEEFQEKYRYQLQDEEQAQSHANDEALKQADPGKIDPANMAAVMEKLQKLQAVQSRQAMTSLNDLYAPNLFGGSTVYVLEERQIGQRSYPTRYVVLYQDQALRKPGYRLSWMTVSDDAIKAAQATSLVSEKQEEGRKKEREAAKKRQEALEDLTKKKDEQQKKKFKQEQSDLEKQLGF